MTAVDVLAVLESEINSALAACKSAHGSPRLTALWEAHAAVAELVAAAHQAREVLGTIDAKYRIRIGPYATRANTAAWALHAALARVQGGAS